MDSKRLFTSALVCAVVAAAVLPSRAAAQVSHARLTQGSSVRVVGPMNERVPVLNVGGATLKLKVVRENNETVAATGWHTDSPDVATVNGSGTVTPRDSGFATVYAETGSGQAKCFVAVMKVTPQTGAMVQGDTKADAGGNVYLSDPFHHVIMRIRGLESGPWVGSSDMPAFQDGPGATARFDEPTGLGIDLSATGGVYVADTLNHCIRKVGFDGRVGTAQKSSVVIGQAQTSGTMNGAGPFALDDMKLSAPQGVVSVGGSLYIADTGNHCLWYADVQRKRVWLVAGAAGTSGSADGEGGAARFSSPSGLAINTRGNLLAVADTGNDVVRLVRLRPTSNGGVVGTVTTLGLASSGKWADAEKARKLDDTRDAIVFDAPRSVSIDGAGNVYVIDANTASVVTRPEESAPVVVGLAANGTLGHAVSLTLDGPRALVLDGAADQARQAVREVTVGGPVITSLSRQAVGLEGGDEIVVEGRNFAPESEVTIGDAAVTDYEVESATRIRLVVPAVRSPGGRTLSVLTRGGAAQSLLSVQARSLDSLAVGEITTVAGGVPYIGDGGLAPAALVKPNKAAVDGSGNLFVADTPNNRIRRVDAATGLITTVAGTGEAGYNGDDQPATAAELDSPTGVAIDASGNLFISDFNNRRIRRVDTATGRITTVPGTAERLGGPQGVALDAEGDLFIADSNQSLVYRVAAASGEISIYAGTGTAGYDGDDKPATAAKLKSPFAVALDAEGNLFIADYFNFRIRRVDAATKRITTYAGTGIEGYDGDDRPATAAKLGRPADVALDADGNLFIADSNNSLIRRVNAATQQIETVAGNGAFGHNGDGIPATEGALNSPFGVALDASGNFFVADTENHRIRRVDATTKLITTYVGTGERGYSGDGQLATVAQLVGPVGVALDASGDLFIAEYFNHRIRRVASGTGLISTYAGTGERDYNGDDLPATEADLAYPIGMAVSGSGDLFIADSDNDLIRRVDEATGLIENVAGTGQAGYNGDDKPATEAQLFAPSSVALTPSGDFFIADSNNNRIRHVDAATGLITTVAGPADHLANPSAVALDTAGNLYIADTDNHLVRRVDKATGAITIYAGTGVRGYNGDNQPATEAELAHPKGLALDAAGNLFIADFDNNRVRRVDAVTKQIATVAGMDDAGYTGDGLPGTAAQLTNPSDVALDAEGNLFVADYGNGAIRVVKRPSTTTGPGDEPHIERAAYSPAKSRLTIVGSDFGATGAAVTVNGEDRTTSIRKQKDGKLVLKGSTTALGLRAGPNEIVVTVGGVASNSFTLTL